VLEKRDSKSLFGGMEILLAAVVAVLAFSLCLNLYLFKRVKIQNDAIVKFRNILNDLENRLNSPKKPPVQGESPSGEVNEPVNAASEIAGRWYGLCAKNRIASIEDFHRIVDNDPVLARHFADFDWKNARMGHLEEALSVRVAYRKDDMIRTTRRAIRLPKGDGYITDGKTWVRTFCCNDYTRPRKEEEAEVKLDSGLTADSESTAETAASRNSGLEEIEAKLDSGLNDSGNKTPYEKHHNFIVDVIPEPNTFLLIAAGIAGLVLSGRIRKDK
jgi:hypothetical protein